MAKNNFHYTKVEQRVLNHLTKLKFKQLPQSVEDTEEQLYFIINTEDKVFWLTDPNQLSDAKIIGEVQENELVETDLNTVLSWEN